MDKRTENEGFLATLWLSFMSMSFWRKAALIVTLPVTAPLLLFVGVFTAMALFPLLLLGRFEGANRKSVLGDVKDAAMRVHERSEQLYYASK